MLISAVRFVSLFLTALVTGTAYCHTVEGLSRSELVSGTWLAVQQQLYWGFDLMTGMLEGGALITTAIVAAMARDRRRTLALNGIALFCLTMMLVVWVAGLGRIGETVSGWTVHTMPPNWPEYRNRWDWLQGARAALGMIALGAQILSLMIDQAAVVEQDRERATGGLAAPARMRA
jgi:hypothetical protein